MLSCFIYAWVKKICIYLKRNGGNMEQEYKYTFNNLKRELREFTTQQLNKKLEEQQKELMKRTIELSSGSSTRVTYTRETKFNLKKIHRIIATIKTVLNERKQ